jgi:hypothetical protein
MVAVYLMKISSSPLGEEKARRKGSSIAKETKQDLGVLFLVLIVQTVSWTVASGLPFG